MTCASSDNCFAAPVVAANSSARMEQFYAEQAEDYDAFRERLLPGRRELLAQPPLPNDAVVADLGGGTGANLEHLPASAHRHIRSWYVVDLSESLLAIAPLCRKARHQWQHVDIVLGDATCWQPALAPDLVGVVLLFAHHDSRPAGRPGTRATCILKPGGHLAVCRFHRFPVSDPPPPRSNMAGLPAVSGRAGSPGTGST